ncbi:MAG: cyclic nucleotide-binding domain-containing protein [Treponema sp.]|jgi:CRP-like cAMP-binding protein|nr:cyclic nucleotide-binding domain-containing protein [Treponema sp.]
MPKPFQYRAGSLVYFQGDAAEYVFILQSGKVSLVYQDTETKEDVRDQVQSGEFFGVKSALGRFPREENAVTLADSTIMAFTVPEFEALAMANTRIIMKMLRVFSSQMRRIHTRVSSLMEKKKLKPDEGLYNVGEYYMKNERFSQARYVFSRYLTYYPLGENAAQALKNLEIAEAAIAKYGEVKSPKAVVPRHAAPTVRRKVQSDAAKAYYDAISLISQEKYQQAYLAFKKIVDANEDPEWTARGAYEIGRCMFFLKKYDDSVKYYTAMLTQYPRHPYLKDVVFLLGQCYEKLGKKGQAAAFYTKILSMPAEDDLDDGTVTKAKRALKAMEG